MADPTPTGPASPEPAAPAVAERLRRAVAAHPLLKDQKKLRIDVERGRTLVQGSVFTQDMLRQLYDLVDRVAGAEPVRVEVEAEVKAPQRREIVGRVPAVSPGPSNVDREYSVGHLRRRPR